MSSFDYLSYFINLSSSVLRYYFCFGRQTIGLECAPGLEFDRVAERCDFPQNANCVVRRYINLSNQLAKYLLRSLFQINIPTPRPPPQEIDFQCSSNSGFVQEPHPTDCRFYFNCFNGQNLERSQCPDGLLFDVNSNACQVNTVANCLPGTN